MLHCNNDLIRPIETFKADEVHNITLKVVSYRYHSFGKILSNIYSCPGLSVGAGHFGHKTLRHRVTSAPQNW